MPIIEYEVFLDTDVFEAIQEQISKSGAIAQNVVKLTTQRSRRRLRKQFVAPENLPTLPFIWSLDPIANARARAYYFAVIVPQHPSDTGRYERTGELLRGLQITAVKDSEGDLILVSTDYEGAPFVIGEQQVPSHSETPWFRLDDLILDESELATNEAIDLWFTLVDPFAGVPQS